MIIRWSRSRDAAKSSVHDPWPGLSAGGLYFASNTSELVMIDARLLLLLMTGIVPLNLTVGFCMTAFLGRTFGAELKPSKQYVCISSTAYGLP